jgi:phage-related protein
MVPALTSILSLGAALPGIFVAAQVALGVLKAALANVGDVLKEAFSDDPAKFEEALKKLSPQAREFAKAVHEIAPFLKEVQQGIQDAFFSNNFEDLFPRIKSALKSLQPSLSGMAQQFGAIAKSIVDFGTSAASIDFVQSAIDHFRAALDNISPSIIPVLKGLRDVGTVGLPLMDRLSVAIGEVAQRFGEWLSAVAADGRLDAWIATALSTLSELGQIIGNVGAILNAVFSAAQATGGGLLGTIAEITGEARRFLESAEGSAAITELFAGILSVAKQLAPIFTTLAGALASALGPALEQIALGVGPELLKVIQALAPAFGPLASAIADVLGAVAPLVPPLAALVALLVTDLSAGLSALAAEIGPVVALFGGTLLKAFQMLMPLVSSLAAQVIPLAQAFGEDLLTALAPLAPVILELAQAFLDALGPALPEIMASAQQVIPALIELATVLSGALAQGLTAVIPLIPPIVSAFVALISVGAGLVTFFIRLATTTIQTGTLIAGAIAGLIGWFTRLPGIIGGALSAAYAFVVGVGQTILSWFLGLPPKIGAALAALPGIIAASFRRALELAATALGFGIGLLVGIAVKLPARIAQAIVALPGAVSRVAQQAWDALGRVFNAGVAAAVSFARNLPGRARAAIQSLGSLIAGVATAAWNSLKARFTAGVSQAASIARTLPGRIKGALGNLGGILYSAGAAIINGLINGIQSGIGRVLGMVSGLAGRVKGAFNSAMEIFSPSRVMFRAGVFIDEGLIEGIKSKIKEVAATAQLLAGAVIRPSVNLRSAVGTVVANATIPNVAKDAADEGAGFFGPYNLEIDGQVITSIVVDTITGNPTVVSKASKEGSRQDAWAGAGGRGRGTR